MTEALRFWRRAEPELADGVCAYCQQESETLIGGACSVGCRLALNQPPPARAAERIAYLFAGIGIGASGIGWLLGGIFT